MALMSVMRFAAVSVAFSSVCPALPWADDVDGADAETIAAHAPADADAFTPGLTRSSAQGRGITTGAVSWNGASKKTTVDLNGEVQLFGPVRLVLRVDNVFDTARPGIGAAVQWLAGVVGGQDGDVGLDGDRRAGRAVGRRGVLISFRAAARADHLGAPRV